MRRFGVVFIFAVALLSMQGCSLRAHQQFLQACHNQNDVSNRFGLPAEEIHGQTTEWIYNLASHRDSLNGKIFVKVADSMRTNKEAKYYKYLEFTFDSNGNVIGYTSNVKDPVRTINRNNENLTAWRIVGITLVTAALVYLSIITKSDISF